MKAMRIEIYNRRVVVAIAPGEADWIREALPAGEGWIHFPTTLAHVTGGRPEAAALAEQVRKQLVERQPLKV